MRDDSDVVIVGAGFTGLSAGLSLARSGKKVTLVEMEENPGGLAGTFSFKDGIVIEKYYHHWFTHDSFVLTLAESLGLGGKLKTLKSRTGMFFQKKIWNMSTPLDLLRFDALPFLSRIRLGLVVLGIRFIRNWRSIEHLTVKEWLEPLCGKRAYAVVWEPLIRSKFGSFAESVNAVWFWKKLVLRGSTRDSNGNEQLMYFDGGFGDFSRAIATELCRLGGEIITSAKVTGVTTEGNAIKSLQTSKGAILGKQFLFTAAFPQIAEIVDGAGEKKWTESLRRLNYLGNICLVLELSKSLSDTYWLNVNDPGFPFVGVIEHTNLDTDQRYSGKHIVFLSRYISTSEREWSYSDEEYFEYAIPWLQIMFPELERGWINDYAIWRTPYGQPITERMYSSYLPGHETPFENAKIYTMAQIYPEDRGTNYAIREGELAAKIILSSF